MVEWDNARTSTPSARWRPSPPARPARAQFALARRLAHPRVWRGQSTAEALACSCVPLLQLIFDCGQSFFSLSCRGLCGCCVLACGQVCVARGISLRRCCCSWPCDTALCVCTATWPLLYRQLPLCAGDPLTVENVPMSIAPWRSIHQLTHPFCTRSVPCPVARPQKGTSVELTRRLVGVGEPRRLAVKTAATMVEASTAPVAANAGGDNPDVFLSKVLQKILSEKEVS